METLIIAGGNINFEMLLKYRKIGKKQNIIAVDKGLEALFQLDILPDHVVGDFDSIDKEILKKYQKNSQIIFHEYRPEKDNTDTDMALKLAIELKSSHITVIGALGKRMDHAISNIHILKDALKAKIPCQIVDEYNKIYLIKDNILLNKKETYGKYISLIPLTTTVEGVTLKGFKYLLQNATFVIGESLGVSNELIEEIGYIEIKKGIFIVIESKD